MVILKYVRRCNLCTVEQVLEHKYQRFEETMCCSQSGEIIGPSHQTCQRGGPHQVGWPDTQGRPCRHG